MPGLSPLPMAAPTLFTPKVLPLIGRSTVAFSTTTCCTVRIRPYGLTKRIPRAPAAKDLQKPDAEPPGQTQYRRDEYIQPSNKSHTPSDIKKNTQTTLVNGKGSAEVKQNAPATLDSAAIRVTPDGQLKDSASFGSDKFSLKLTEDFYLTKHEFLYSAGRFYDHPINIHLPEIVLIGASNVGKSSFINSLIHQHGAARVSQRPGFTATMNAFGVGPPLRVPKDQVPKGQQRPQHSMVLMDTPGYGYKSRDEWGETITKYLQKRRALKGAVVLLSSHKKKLLDADRWVLRALAEANTRTLLILTKADSVKGKWQVECQNMAADIRDTLRKMSERSGTGWKEGSGWNPDILVTSAELASKRRSGSAGGMGGARMAILEMAGYEFEKKGQKVGQKAENMTYTGPIVSFDNLIWK